MSENIDEQLEFVLVQSIQVANRLNIKLDHQKNGEKNLFHFYSALGEAESHLHTLRKYLNQLIELKK